MTSPPSIGFSAGHTTVAVPSSPSLLTELTRRMPTELLTSVFDRIGQPSLLNTAQVSRRWRSVSLAHPDHYCHVSLFWLYTTEEFEPRVAAFTTALSYIRSKRLKLSVDLDCGWLDNDLPDDDEETRARFEPILELNRVAVLPAIEHNLEMLVKLRTDLPVQLNRPLFRHLVSAPAPKLTFLSLKFSIGFRDGQNSPLLPASIFQGVAPRLTSLQLEAVFPGTDLASAFSKVRTVEIGCDRCAEVANESFDLTRHFPSLAIPHIKVDTLSGALRNSMVHMDRCQSLHIQFLHDEIYIEPFVRTLTWPTRVSLRSTDGVCARLKVTSADKRTRLFVVYARDGSFATMASQLTSLAPLVTKLEADHNLLDAIPILLPSLPELRYLRVHASKASCAPLRTPLTPTTSVSRCTDLHTVTILLDEDLDASKATTSSNLSAKLNVIDPGSGEYTLTICTPAEKSILAVEGRAWSSLGAAIDALYLKHTRSADNDGSDVPPTA